jgi:hypothetical protein
LEFRVSQATCGLGWWGSGAAAGTGSAVAVGGVEHAVGSPVRTVSRAGNADVLDRLALRFMTCP